LPQMTPVCKPHAAANLNPCASHTLHKPRAAQTAGSRRRGRARDTRPAPPCVGAESRRTRRGPRHMAAGRTRFCDVKKSGGAMLLRARPCRKRPYVA